MNVYLDTVGCRLNQSEIEKMAGQFRAAGHTLVDKPEVADLIVVNTCAVTAEAASDSRQKIRQAGRSGRAEVIVTGCWATLESQGAYNLPGVARVISNNDKQNLVAEVLQIGEGEIRLEAAARIPIPGMRSRTRAFIKVQDGCDNHCTYCIARVARGHGKSLPVQDILYDIQLALEGGTQEIVLTGVHLGSWGQDFASPQRLKDLIQAILEKTTTPRLRLSSVEPWDVDAGFLELIDEPRFCRQLHLPLQSGCDATLRRMGRKITPTVYAQLIETIRQISPDIAITTDIIAGFPGETEEEYRQSLAFIQKIEFAGGHVFTFSARQGTPAANYSDQIPTRVRKERNAAIRSVVAASSERYRARFVGAELMVLWESVCPNGQENWRLEGLSDNYIRVEANSSQQLWNQTSLVCINGMSTNGLTGILTRN